MIQSMFLNRNSKTYIRKKFSLPLTKIVIQNKKYYSSNTLVKTNFSQSRHKNLTILYSRIFNISGLKNSLINFKLQMLFFLWQHFILSLPFSTPKKKLMNVLKKELLVSAICINWSLFSSRSFDGPDFSTSLSINYDRFC